MKLFTRLLILTAFLCWFGISCSGSKTTSEEFTDISPEEDQIFKSKTQDTVRIANDSIEYEIIIIEPGFYQWLNSIAHPRGYYTQQFMENRNRIYVTNWNIRVNSPGNYDPNMYFWPINYETGIDYGYEVNYQLFNYFLYFQRKYKQQLGPFLPRIN